MIADPLRDLSDDLPLEAVGEHADFAPGPCGLLPPAYRTAFRDYVHRRVPAPEERQRRDDKVANCPRPAWMADPQLLPRSPPRRTPQSTPMGEWAARAYRESVRSR